MKTETLLMLAVILAAAFSCARTRAPRSSVRQDRQDICEGRTPEACWEWAQALEETGDLRMLQVLETACSRGVSAACERLLDEADITLFPMPGTAAESWKPSLDALCVKGNTRACRQLDMVSVLDSRVEPDRMKQAFFNRLEACRKEPSQCVFLVQALSVVERRNAAMFKANALSALQAACDGGVAEACYQDPLLQVEKRDLAWMLPFLLRGCKLGDTFGCAKLVEIARRALFENMPRYPQAEPFLKQACFDMDYRAACLAWAAGHVRRIWTQPDPRAGRDELLRHCRLGDNESCTEFARFLLRHEPDQRGWALQILRQTCSDSYQDACVEWILAMEKGSPEERRAAVVQARASCLGAAGVQMPNYEYEYAAHGRTYGSLGQNPSCVLYGRFIVESDGREAPPAAGERLMGQVCGHLAHPVCLDYAPRMMAQDSTTAAMLTALHERICKAGHAAGCLAMAALQRRGYKELKPNEASAKEYTALACRLDPRLAECPPSR